MGFSAHMLTWSYPLALYRAVVGEADGESWALTEMVCAEVLPSQLTVCPDATGFGWGDD